MNQVKNKNIRAMAWLTLLVAVLGTITGLFTGKHLPDYYYLFSTGVIGFYMGVSKWGEINDS